jgi:LysM repeat protein
MLRVRVSGLFAVLLVLMSCLGGCVQEENHAGEEKDPHFQRGRSLAAGQDFKGAAQEFELALESNPRSAAAHFELGWLYDTKLNDYAAAIYHYERHLEFDTNSSHAKLVQERILGCEQQLANGEFALPYSRNLQRQVDQLNAENTSLKQQLDALQKQLAAANAALAQQPRYVAAPAPVPAATSATTDPVAPARSPAPARGRVHIVKSHETINSIAAEYGVKPSLLLAANPQTNPRRLRVGQSLNLP